MAKLKQVTIEFNFKKGKCDVCGEEGKPIVEVGDITKFSICDECSQGCVDIHNNMKLMKPAE